MLNKKSIKKKKTKTKNCVILQQTGNDSYDALRYLNCRRPLVCYI